MQYTFIFWYWWLCSEDNFLADALSRDKEEEFLEKAYSSGFWDESTVPVRHGNAGKQRVLPESRGHVKLPRPVPARVVRPGASVAKALFISMFAFCMLTPIESAPHGSKFTASVSYSRSSVFLGLPSVFTDQLETVLDNRFSSSSWRTIKSGVKLWREVAATYEWSPIIATDDVHRGGKLSAFVLTLAFDTDLVWGSIEAYTWGMRSWMRLQHQADPALGVMGYDDLMASVKVLTWTAGEPRRQLSISVLKRIIDNTDRASFMAVQLVFLLLLMTYTFQRSECPLPKSWEGRERYHADVHMRAEDVDTMVIDGQAAFRCRLRVIKQNPRAERPEAHGDGDWVIVGDLPGTEYSIITWYLRCQQFIGRRTDMTASLFLDDDMSRPWLYRKALAFFHSTQRACGMAENELVGFAGCRVAGWNGTKDKLGKDMAQAQGGWMSNACNRYSRFALTNIVHIPAAIMEMGQYAPESDDAVLALPAPEERDAGPPATRLVRRGGPSVVPAVASSTRAQPKRRPARGSAAPSVPVSSALLPPGWHARLHDGPSLVRSYTSYVGPNGEKAQSRQEAWNSGIVGDDSDGGSSGSSRASSSQLSASASSSPLLADVVVEADRPSSRRGPVARSGQF